jgi:two-component system response regulator AlgR
VRIAIVDDEPLARARLRAQLEDDGLGEVVAEGANGNEALGIVETSAPDVLLLDIRMPGMDGLEAARHLMKLPAPPAVIFTTAYDEHALAAFEANAIDYLLKPIRANRLRQALDKARALTGPQSVAIGELADPAQRSHVSGIVHGNLSLVAVAEILYFQADQGYVDVVWTEGTMLIEESLRSLEQEFPQRFLRVHRNALVAVEHVTGLRRDEAGNHFIEVRGCTTELPVSRRLLNQVKTRLRQGSAE